MRISRFHKIHILNFVVPILVISDGSHGDGEDMFVCCSDRDACCELREQVS